MGLPLKMTSGKQWEFDGVSGGGTSMFYFGFYRGPNYSILRINSLRLVSEWAHADGSKFVRADYPLDSIVESCTWGTRLGIAVLLVLYRFPIQYTQ